MRVRHEAGAAAEGSYQGSSRPFGGSPSASPAYRRVQTALWLPVATLSIEAGTILIAAAAILHAFRSLDSMGQASWAILVSLPLFNGLILAKRQFYTLNHLLFAPIQPLRLAGAWLEAFGAAVVLSVLIRAVEPVRLHHVNIFAPELAALFGGGLIMMFANRLGWAAIRRRFAVHAMPRVLFIGGLDPSRRLIAQLREETTIRLVDSIDCRELFPEHPDHEPAASGATIGAGDRLAALLERDRIDAIVVALPQMREDAVAAVTATAQRYGVTTVALPGLSLRRDLRPALTTIGRLPMIRHGQSPPSAFAAVQKRASDVILGSAVLLAIAPVMAIIALLIRRDSPGPVLFRQIRVGRGGALFEILKFRTMVHPGILPGDASSPPDGGKPACSDLQTRRDDKRITRIGTFLRRHSLDELPQILNVLRGEMSIIGPRPHAAAMTVESTALEALVPDYPARFAMRPGITGWAQINGRRGMIDGLAQLQMRVDHDLYYIENWSIGFDMAILFRTIACIIRDTQAF